MPRFPAADSPLSVLVGFALLSLLLGPTLAQGAEPPADSLSAAALAFQLRYDPASQPDAAVPAPQPRDRWFARDKAMHVAGSALWTLSTQYVLVNKAHWTERDALPASLASGAGVGLAKELYDATRPAQTASGKDLVANAMGLGLAAGLILL